MPRRVFVTGSTGYLGRAVSAALMARGHTVDALCRQSARHRLADGANAIIGDPLDASTYAMALRADHVVVHLVGTPKPAPWKGESFRRVDLGSVQQLARETRLPLTILRPWYVLGPGHRWPIALLPIYWIAERIPSLRAGARRLGLVTLNQMVSALVVAVETTSDETRIWDVERIRQLQLP